MAEKNWAKLLHAIYAGDQTEDVEPARRLAAATGLSDDEIERSLAFLQRQGLIEDEERRFVLTEKGF